MRNPILPMVSLMALSLPIFAAPATTELISARDLNVDQLAANHPSSSASISGTGRFIAFQSEATDLVENDTNNASDIFVYDRSTGKFELVSISSSGVHGNAWSEQPTISANGRFVAFASVATNLTSGVPRDTGDSMDVFLHDRSTHKTIKLTSTPRYRSRISGISISSTGRFLAYSVTINNSDFTDYDSNLFVYDADSGSTQMVNVTPLGERFDAAFPSISASGRLAAFVSLAGNITPNDLNGLADVFVYDRQLARFNRMSLGSEGDSSRPAISANGRYVAFTSPDSTLVPGDTNGKVDIFVRDRETGTTRRVSVSSSGVQANGDSDRPQISADGRIVTYMSRASNLVPNDTNGSMVPTIIWFDTFTYDTSTGVTKRINVSPTGKQVKGNSGFPSISSDGLHVAFESDSSNLVAGDGNLVNDVFVRDLGPSRTELVSVNTVFTSTGIGASATGDFHSGRAVSSDGRYVVFSSLVTTLVPGDTNGKEDVFIRDRSTGKTTRLSVGPNGVQGNAASLTPSISANGRYVAFASFASNLVAGATSGSEHIFLRDRSTGVTSTISVSSTGAQADNGSASPSVSDSGRYVAFVSGAGNLTADGASPGAQVYLRDRQAGVTRRLSLDPYGNPANGGSSTPSISGNGQFVAFNSDATNLVRNVVLPAGSKVVMRDLQTGITTLVSIHPGSQPSLGGAPSVSADGRYVAFEWGEIYVRDRQQGRTIIVTPAADSSLESSGPAISADGRYVAYTSRDDSIVQPDLNASADIFLYDLQLAKTVKISGASGGAQAYNSGDSTLPSISADGRYIAYTSKVRDLVDDDRNDASDVFLYTRATSSR